MNATKAALILGITMIGLLGAVHYLKMENGDMTIEIRDQLLEQRLQLFKEWTAQFKRNYGVEETKMRFEIWNNRYDWILEHNAKDLSWKAGLNQFSDQTSEEFAALNLGYNYNPNRIRNVKVLEEDMEPVDVDWRTKNAVSAIKDQGQCGACWSFSATGALEGLYAIKKAKLFSFSEQQLMDCSTSYGNQACNGGLMDNAFKYTQSQGVMNESAYPYTAKNGTKCKFNASGVIFKNTGYSDVTANSSKQLKAAVSKGPVSVAIEADQTIFQNYKSGILNDTSCGTTLDHGVLAVGYKGSSYWIVKNSWGTTWGQSGYIWIAAGDQSNGAGICGINMDASYPTLSSTYPLYE